jgi:hypothetical protein
MGALLSAVLGIAFLSASFSTFAAEVGRVLLVAGEAFAVRAGTPVKLVRGAPVHDRDLLRTGPRSTLQVRFADESLLSLRENSEVRIDDFRFSGKEDGTERAFFSLLKGGLRKITGLIGRTNHQNYRMDTAVATIGIRGTDYAATLCQQDCRNPDGSLARDGLYGRVIGASHGTNRNSITNKTGEHLIGIGQNYHVPDAGSPPQLLLEPPPFVNTGVAGRAPKPPSGTGKEETVAGGAPQDPRGTTPPAPPPPPPPQFLATEERTTSGTLTAIGSTPATAIGSAPTLGVIGAYVDAAGQGEAGGAYVTPSMMTFDSEGTPVSVNIPAGTTKVEGIPIAFPGVIGSAGLLDQSGSADPRDGSINARWARWAGGTLTDDAGTTDLFPGGLHVMVGNLTPPDVVAAKTGSLFYLPIGGTTPTNHLNETASPPYGTYPDITVNFTSRTVDINSFFWVFQSNSWSFPSGTGSVVITPGKGAGFVAEYSGGSCIGTGCGGGNPITLNVTGIFYGPRADHLGAGFAASSGSARAMGVQLYTPSAQLP